jgi:hypothetical protein
MYGHALQEAESSSKGPALSSSDMPSNSSSAAQGGLPESVIPIAAAAAAAAAAVGSSSTSTTNLTSSEFEGLLEDLVHDSGQMKLADLESKLEIIRPEDLQVK